MDKKIIIVGAGVSGVQAATKLVDNNYPGELITIIDVGKDPYKRQPNELMLGFLGSGGFSDGKITKHHMIGGQLSKYCGIDKAYSLMDEVIETWKRFHPKPEQILFSHPTEEPEFIKPYFNLRLTPVYHIGTDFLKEIGKNWYDYLIEKGVNFIWEKEVEDIDFKKQIVYIKESKPEIYDILIYNTGKSGIDLTQKLIDKHQLPTEVKSTQVGVRFEAPQKYFQKLIDVSYDFKLYKKFEKEGISIRSFCSNSSAAYVAVEETYGDLTYNGHAKKDPSYKNDMVNFGILMEIKDIKKPFEWARSLVNKCQEKVWISKRKNNYIRTGLFYSPNGTRSPSKDSEGNPIKVYDAYNDVLDIFKGAFGEYSNYILNFIEDLKKVFPLLGDDWGIYIPEVKYLSDEVKVDYSNLSLIDYPNVYFVGDSLSARGISISSAQAIYATENILSQNLAS